MLWDPIRCCSVKATPEEQVRQAWIAHMMGALGYPKSLLSIEKEISAIFQGESPQRRFDILCLTPGGDGLIPLLLLECKAEKISPSAEKQLVGYNTFIRAPFLCLASKLGAVTFWKEEEKIMSVPFLPSYNQLVSRIQ